MFCFCAQEFNAKQLAQWDGVVTSLESLELQHSTGLKGLIRSGIPYHLRVSNSMKLVIVTLCIKCVFYRTISLWCSIRFTSFHALPSRIFKIKLPSLFVNPAILGELWICEVAASAHVMSK
jgi:hypothetical protein